MTEDPMGTSSDAVALLRERVARAEAALAQAQLEIEALRDADIHTGRDTIVLTRLVETLRWENAPRALQLVLPLARVARRISGGLAGLLHPRLVAADGPAPPAEEPAPPARRSLGRRMAVRGYTLARPLALPLAIRLHALLTRLLEREAVVAQRGAAATNFATSADAELLRSIEAAMLTLALQRRDGRP
jgi:hypothetical protein